MFCLKNFSVFLPCLLLFIIQPGRGSEIIGGKEVRPHSLPFMAYLRSEKYACGGTLIHPQWVLTAAHCTDMTKVTLGAHSIKKEENSKQVREVEKSFPHPDYQDVFQGNDLMLLKLNKRVVLTRTVKWLKFGQTVRDPAAGSKCLVAGWGLIENNQRSDVLRSVRVTVVDREKCNSRDYYNHRPVITSDMVCAGSNGANKAGTCKGDSGGPLLCNGELVGVTSFGPLDCGIMKKPGVYSFVSEKQLKWIKETMNSNE